MATESATFGINVPDEYSGPPLKIRLDLLSEISPATRGDIIIPKFKFGESKDGDDITVEWLDADGIWNKTHAKWRVEEVDEWPKKESA